MGDVFRGSDWCIAGVDWRHPEMMREPAEDRLAGDAARITDLVFRGFYLLLGARFLFALMGTGSENTLVRVVEGATGLLHAPFRAMLPGLMDGPIPLALPALLTLFLYAVLHGLIKAFFRKLGPRPVYL